MIPVAWIDRLEEDLSELMMPIWYAPVVFWLGVWTAYRVALSNLPKA